MSILSRHKVTLLWQKNCYLLCTTTALFLFCITPFPLLASFMPNDHFLTRDKSMRRVAGHCIAQWTIVQLLENRPHPTTHWEKRPIWG